MHQTPRVFAQLSGFLLYENDTITKHNSTLKLAEYDHFYRNLAK